MAAELLFARYAPKTLEPDRAIGAKWERLLDRLELAGTVKGKRVAVKMHLGGGGGFSTIHPYFVRRLVGKLKEAGCAEVFVTDMPGNVRDAANRGYTAETLGCAILPVAGSADKYLYTRKIEPAFRTLTEVHLAGEVMDADVLVDLAHVKGHGACGFGGASKNLSMGAVTGTTRGDIHRLEGGLDWSKDKCTRCRKCVEHCPNGAMSFTDAGELEVFYHHCKYCQHCVLICPERAIRMVGGRYKDFQQGMALTTAAILDAFRPDRALFINLLMDITVWCDCWGMTTPQLVPDIGILAGRDIVAIEQASLDLIRAEDLIPGSLPPGWKLRRKGTHLFDRIHSKDPYEIVRALAKLGAGNPKYRVTEVD